MKNKIRMIFQFIILGLIGYVAVRPAFDNAYVADFESYCPFGGVSSFMSKLNQGTMACNMSEVQAMLGIGLLIGIIIVGKLFCSYVCPIGTITEWIGRLGRKMKLNREMPSYLDRPLRSLKYVLLFLSLYYTMTSSELFCKEFDPYFASANLFGNPDSVLYYAIPAFVLAILGALVFKLFWCKYLCPLGALSNIFLNVVGAGAVIIIYLAANYFGTGLSLVWMVGGLVLVGMLNELGFMRRFLAPVPKITRNTDLCNGCGLCDKKCPQGIKISQLNEVSHIDCTLCTDCVYTCKTKNALTVSKKKNLKYLAPIATVVFILVSLGASKNIEFTTLSERWGNFKSLKNVEIYEQTGLKSVKCFGSASSLMGKLETVEGIVGLDAYARSHTVKIYYDPSVISEKKVKAALFTSVKQEVRKLKDPALTSLKVYEVGVYNLFDLIDFNNLFYVLKNDAGVYGFETHYGEPVRLVLYYDPAVTSVQKMRKEIEQKKVMAAKPTGKEEIELDFELADQGKDKGTIAKSDYIRQIFKIYDREFNEYIKYKPEELSALVFPMPEANNPLLRRKLGMLSSHLSADSGVVRLSTRYFDVPSGIIYFNPKITNVEKIKKALVLPNLTIFLSDTETKEVENPFHIKPGNGKIVSASELKIDDEDVIL